jgi:hypothetical protein
LLATASRNIVSYMRFLKVRGGFGWGVLFYICHVARVLAEVGQLYRYALDMRGGGGAPLFSRIAASRL